MKPWLLYDMALKDKYLEAKKKRKKETDPKENHVTPPQPCKVSSQSTFCPNSRTSQNLIPWVNT
jgi:hypothetical protein